MNVAVIVLAVAIVKSSSAFLPAANKNKYYHCPNNKEKVVSLGQQQQRGVVTVFRRSSTPPKRSRSSTPLFGIAEWRDTLLDQFPGTKGRIVPLTPGTPKASNAFPHEICVLPFSHEDCLVQGQTKNLHLFEDRYIKLFDYCMTHHSGVVAMGLVADTGVIQTVPLCEIESFSRIEGFGVFASIRVVGRASLLELIQQEPYIRALGVEITDAVPPNFDVPNLLASNIENTMITLSSLSHKLDNEESSSSNGYDVISEEDDTEEDENDFFTRDLNEQFQYAFHQALNSDTQGYTTVRSISSSSSSSFLFKGLRSVQQLSALSWSAFCIAPMDVSYKLQALDCNDLFDRLKLAAYALRELKHEMEAKVALRGIDKSSRQKRHFHDLLHEDDEDDTSDDPYNAN